MESSYSLFIKSDDLVHPDSDEIIKALHRLFEDKIKASGSNDPELAEFSVAVCNDDNEIAKRRMAANHAIVERGKQVRATVSHLKEKGYSNAAIASKIGISESSIRTLLKPEGE